jgi:uncharacterized protein (TIGR03435 family)
MRLAAFMVSLLAALSAGLAQKPAFEVASIKPSTVGGPITTPPGRFIAVGQSLKGLIEHAYRVRDYQILGGPGWMSSDRWEIQAKVPDGVIVPRASTMEELEKMLTTPDAVSVMLQSLLQERFQLTMHRENRELPIYELSIGRGGSKMTLAEDQTPIVFGPPPSGPPIITQALTRGGYSIRSRPDRRSFEGKAISLWRVVNLLVNELGRPVVDKTGLTGLYDVKLEWAPETLQAVPENVPPGASRLTTAIQEQLGLKLESTKGLVEVIVVDSAQKPSEN